MTLDAEPNPDAFQLRLPVFEGPLDLLLYLIEKEQLDITAVSLVQVTDQYLTYLRSGDQIDASALAEFIVIAARLLLIKSRALLPRPPALDEEEEDLGADLVRRLREYRRFKEAAAQLRDLADRGLHAYPRMTPPTGLPVPTGLDGVTLEKLSKIVQDVLSRRPEEEAPVPVPRLIVTVEEKIVELTSAIRRGGKLSFRQFISSCSSRLEIIVSFLAVLELIKSLKLTAEQDSLFGEISLVALVEAPATAP
jgi:segregation and condensation protein A